MERRELTKRDTREGAAVWYRAAATLTALMLLAQPILAGQFVYGGEPDLKDVHAVVGQSLHITVVIQLILAFLARRRFGIGLAVYNLVLLLVVSIQAGIGFSTDRDLIAIHIPLGTVLLTLGAFAAFLGFFDVGAQRRSDRAS
jgi:hypothetical protein